MTKTCTKCGKEKLLDEFHKDSQGYLGRKSRCKDCISGYMKEWGQKSEVKKSKKNNLRNFVLNQPEKRMVQSARERSKKAGIICAITHKDIVIPEVCPVFGVVLKKGNRENKEDAPSIDRIKSELGYVPGNVAVISYRANRVKNNGSADDHRRIAFWMLSPFAPKYTQSIGLKSMRGLINNARRRAKKIGCEFDIVKEDIVIPQVCPVLGIPLSVGVGRKSRHDGSPTIDRINPAKGYTKDNVGVISYKANRMKNDGTIDEHFKIANWMDEMSASKEAA